jgi:hypothetical protein
VVDGISEYPTKWTGNTAVSGGTVRQAHPHLSAGLVTTEVATTKVKYNNE